MTDTQLKKIKTLQESQKSIKISVGTLMGLILLIFFFTFGMLVDKAPPLFFVIEAIITIIIIPLFFMLNKISFMLLKMGKGKKEEFTAIMAQLNSNDVDKKPEEILNNLASE